MSTFYYQPCTCDEVRARNLGELALWAPLLQQMNLSAIFDQHLPKSPEADFSHGAALINLIAARLCQPNALVHVEQWAEQQAAQLYFDVPADKLNDDRLGRALDAFYPQRQSIAAAIALHVHRHFGLPLDRLHYDPTDVRFYGDYDNSKPRGVKAAMHTVKTFPAEPGSDDPADITFGHTSTKLKAVHVGLSCVVDDTGAVPIFGHVVSGNHNGHIAVAEMFTDWQQHLRPKRLMTFSDRGTYSADHLARLHRQGFYLLCPAPWDDFRPLYEEHRGRLKWKEATYQSLEQQRRRAHASKLPLETYHLAVLRHTVVDTDSDQDIPCRLIFVKSSAQRKVVRRNRRKQLKKLWAQLLRVQANVARGHSRTDEATIAQKLHKLVSSSKAAELVGWSLEPLSEAQRQELPPPKPGCIRPTYRVVVQLKREVWRQQRRDDGIFVLVTNAPGAQSAAELFTGYKRQSYVEQSHHQFKTPIAVRPVFLKTPRRVEALLYVLVIALTAWHLLQRRYRLALPEPQAESKPCRTTTEQLLRRFAGLVVHLRAVPGGSSVEVLPLTQQQRSILARLAFELPAQTFARKFAAVPP